MYGAAVRADGGREDKIGGAVLVPEVALPVECLCPRGLGLVCRVYPVLELLELEDDEVDADPGLWCKF